MSRKWAGVCVQLAFVAGNLLFAVMNYPGPVACFNCLAAGWCLAFAAVTVTD